MNGAVVNETLSDVRDAGARITEAAAQPESIPVSRDVPNSTAAPPPGADTAPDRPMPSDEQIKLYHGSSRADLTVADVEIVRASGQKQGKKGRVYGGFYATLNKQEADETVEYIKYPVAMKAYTL